jgi:hypothetical protein
MNTNNVISLKAAGDLTGQEYKVIKLTSTGADIATSSDGAVMIGTMIRAMPKQEDGVYLGKAIAVHRRYSGVHYAMIGASSAAVAAGATLALDAANAGMLVPSGSNVVAVSVDAFTAASGAIVRVIFV